MRSRRRAVVRFTLGVALAAAVFAYVLPRIASYGDVIHELGTISTAWAVALGAAALLDVLTAALPWMAVLSQLSFLQALAFTQASTALTTVLPGGAPLGMAISFGFLRRLRVDRGGAAFAVAVTGIWSQTMIFLYPLVGAILVFATGQLSTSTAVIAGVSAVAGAAIVGIAVAALRSPAAALRLGNAAARFVAWVKGLFHRPPPTWGGESLVRFREERLVLLRRRWAVLTAATLANQLTAYITFVFSLRAVGITSTTIPLSEAFLAWALGRVISSLPLTPGGIGVVELGMIGTLVGFGAPNAHVVAAVLLFRGLVVLPSLIVGAVGLPALRFLAPDPEPEPS